MNRGLWAFSAVWLAGVILGSALLLIHSNTPGLESGNSPADWPKASALPRSAGRTTLVMFAHPKCPCTRSSIGELEILMARQQGKLDARVVFFRPLESGEEWALTDSWRSAAAIPGVEVQVDPDGGEAAHFRATTSGHVVLYDADGKLLFSGGITQARGHAGDNDGRTAISHLLNEGGPSAPSTPIFGCGIHDPETVLQAAKGS